MKKFLLYLLYVVIGISAVIYIGFLFVLPRVIDLNIYLPDLQNLVKEQTNLDLEIKNPRISTSPLLQAGIKTDEITVKLTDNSTIFSTDGIKARISLPNLLLLTVKVSCLEVNAPKINLEIANGEQFKIVSLVEDILNEQKNTEVTEEEQSLPFDISMIKIKVPNAKITDYNVIIDDTKSKHSLTLKGDELHAGYNNCKFARLRTNASIFSDNAENITANIDVDTFLPPIEPADPDDDPAEKIEIPFVNPVLVYRDYNLQSNLDTKLKIRQSEEGLLYVRGYFNVDDTTMNLSGLQLPTSYIKSKFYGHSADIDTNIAITPEQVIKLSGNVDYSENPKLNLNIFTDKIFYNDMVILARAILDTLHIKNDLVSIKAKGYWAARAQIKTDFKKLNSKGAIIARDGSISYGLANLIFDKINANLIFEGDTLKIVDTHTFINGNILKAEGTIDTNSYTDISVHSERLPLSGLYSAFSPSKNSIAMTSGDLTIDAKIQGEIKKAVAYANVILNNLVLKDKSNAFVISNDKLVTGFVTDLKTIDGNITNKNFSFELPSTNSTIKNPTLTVKLDEKNINIDPFNILINKTSKITLDGSVKEYSSSPKIDFTLDGLLGAVDLRQFAGRDAEPFIDAIGNLPIKAKFVGTDKKQAVTLQVKSDSHNYITPIDIASMLGKQAILQVKFDYKGDRLHIRKTGLYTGVSSFTNDLETNLNGAQKVAEVSGTIVNLNTAQPFINLIKCDIPNEINATISAFKKSTLKANGRLVVFGKLASPLMKGDFKVFDLNIPELLTKMDEANLSLSGKNITLLLKNLSLNGSDISLRARTDINPHPQFTILGLNVRSKFIDVDKLMQVIENLNKYTAPPLEDAQPTEDIPVVIRNGSINLKKIKTGEIVAENTTGRISMRNNIFYLNNLKTEVFDGTVKGDILTNLITTTLDIKTNGEGLNVEKALLATAGMKDTLTGDMSFKTDISLSGATMEEQMKSLKGDVTFVITNGQLGPFGKIENMILAENIRESKFFQTALGGVINNLATIDTSRFSTMDGFITFEDGIAHINPITSIGNVLSLHISGDFNLLENTTDMKVRAKLGSVIANMLGPISQLNPINLVQVTPGLNVVMAQAFSLFCEQLTPEETAALPHLATDLEDKMATKFQIVLRGDVAKPLKLVKSFKWLALASEMEQAQDFVSTLPDPSIVDDPDNATVEEILQAQQLQAELQAKEDAKLTNKIKKFFKKK